MYTRFSSAWSRNENKPMESGSVCLRHHYNDQAVFMMINIHTNDKMAAKHTYAFNG